MKDPINRADAIKHLKKRLYETALNSNTEYPYYEEIADNRIDVWMNEVPSAQPEIIHCKDCIRYGKDNCFMKIQMLWELKPDDFCSYAERRTDEQID